METSARLEWWRRAWFSGLQMRLFSITKGSLLLGLLAALQLVWLIIYLVRGSAWDFNSDTAVNQILAQRVLQSGSFFPPGWNYAEEVWVLKAHLFALPFVPMWGTSLQTHAGASLLALCLMLAGVGWLSWRCSWSWSVRWLAVALIFSGHSRIINGPCFDELSYVWPAVVWLVCAAEVMRYMYGEAPDSRSLSGSLLCLVAVTLVDQLGSARGAILILFPLLAAVGVDALFFSPHLRRRAFSFLMAMFAVCVAAYGLRRLLSSQVMLHRSLSRGFAQPEEWLHNLKLFARGLSALIGAESSLWWSPVYLVAWAVLLFLVAPCVAWRWHRQGQLTAPARFMVIAAVCTTALTAALCLVGKTLVAVESIRYMIVPAFALIVAACAVIDQRRSELQRFGGVALAVALVPLTIISAHTLGVFGLAERGPTPRQLQAQQLVGLDARYGYASYWNAGVLTVASEGKLDMVPVRVLPHQLERFRWHTDEAGFTRDPARRPGFLMLHADEIATLTPTFLARLNQSASQAIPLKNALGDFTVWRFDTNVVTAIGLADLREDNLPQ